MTSVFKRTLLQCGEHVTYFNQAFIVTYVFVHNSERGACL
jgi:hypothetical protein